MYIDFSLIPRPTPSFSMLYTSKVVSVCNLDTLGVPGDEFDIIDSRLLLTCMDVVQTPVPLGWL